MNIDHLLKGLKEGRIGAASRLISIFEEGNAYHQEQILETIFPGTGHGWTVGITGPPGAGKSSLINNLIDQARLDDFKVGVVLIDPSSPITGGAVLGDRIRMSSFARDNKVFIRSMGSRGSLGGLSEATLGAVRILDYMKYDYIFVETVGAGQVDVNVCDIADTICLVLIPGAGDVVQSIKAGIREVNDIYVVNKSDRPGAERVVSHIRQALDHRSVHNPDLPCWKIPICPTDSLTAKGMTALWAQIKQHRKATEGGEYQKGKKKKLAQKEIIESILRKLERFFRRKIERNLDLTGIIEDVCFKRKSPQKASEDIFASIAGTEWSLAQLSEGRNFITSTQSRNFEKCQVEENDV